MHNRVIDLDEEGDGEETVTHKPTEKQLESFYPRRILGQGGRTAANRAAVTALKQLPPQQSAS